MEDIINFSNAPVELSLEEKQARVSAMLSDSVSMLYRQLVMQHNSLMRMFWHNSELTPQQVSDALGTKATALFMRGGALKDLILSIKPDEDLIGVPFELVFEVDGRVTIAEVPVVPVV